MSAARAAEPDDLRIEVLGAVRVLRHGQPVALGPPRRQAVLAVLALRANQVVPRDEIIDAVWGDEPPASAVNGVHVHVGALRQAVEPGRPNRAAGQVLASIGSGYVLRLTPGQLDLEVFCGNLERARRLAAGGELARAVATFDDALALWRGTPLAGVAGPFADAERMRLDELRLAALEDRAETMLGLGHAATLVAGLQALVAAHPLRERLRGLLMLALYRGGRQADALASYAETRRLLVDELGVEPGPQLQRLHQDILNNRDVDLARHQEPRSGRRFVDRVVPGLLPPSVRHFAGRTVELEELNRLADEAAGPGGALVIAAIAGPAGVGKTALAVHWAQQVRDRFEDGQLYVDLRGYAPTPPMRPIEALTGFLDALGVPPDEVPVDPDRAAGLYRSLLAGRRMLVVLDNAGSAEQVRPLLPGSPGCVVLVTSRDRLAGLVAHDGAVRLRLDVLTPAEADVLLAGIVGAGRVEAEPRATAELARACGYLPLALRIAAANLTDRPHQRIADYLGELRDGDRLAALEVDGDERAAVLVAFDLSYDRLAPAAQRMFRLLGLVPGPDITMAAAAALADTTPPEARRLLDRLAGAHLIVEHRPHRYTFHDLLHAYAADRARADSEAPAAVRRLYDWYLRGVDAAGRLLYAQMLRLPLPSTGDTAVAAPAFDDHAEALAWLNAERPNLVAAAVHAERHGLPHLAPLLADSLRGYFWMQTYANDWLAVARAALTAAQRSGDRDAQTAAHLSLADALLRATGDDRSATEHYAHVVDLSGQTGWLDAQAAALSSLGSLYWRSGRLLEAAGYCAQSLDASRRTGRLSAQAGSLGNLGLVHRQMGNLSLAADHYSEALALYRRLEVPFGEAANLGNLGEVYHDLGRIDDARSHFSEALALHRELGNRGGEASVLPGLAGLYRDIGEEGRALEYADAALSLAQELGSRGDEGAALYALASIHHRFGRHRQAVDRYREALKVSRETGQRYPEAETLIGLACLHIQLHESDEAYTCVQDALVIARDARYRLLEGRALTIGAAGHLAAGETDLAVGYAEQAQAIHRETGHRAGLAQALLVLGQALRQVGDGRAAADRWREALTLFSAAGLPEADDVRNLLKQVGTGDVDVPGAP